MSLPTYQAAGATGSGTGNVTPALPTHLTNDVFLCFAESSDSGSDVAIATPSGWAHVTGSPQATGDVSGATRTTVFWKRAASGSETAPTLLDAGNHIVARVLSFRGCITTGNPWNVTAADTEIDVSSSDVIIPGTTTTVADCLVVVAVGTGEPTTSTTYVSGWTNASLGSLTERVDNWENIGNGGGFAVATGTKATAGTYSSTTATLVGTDRQARISIALRPPATSSAVTPGTGALTITGLAPSAVIGGNNPVFQAAGTAVNGTGNVSPAWPTHAINDIGLLFAETANQSVSTPTGWLEIAGSPRGTSVAVPTRITVFWRRALTASEAAPTLVDPGDHIIAQILTFRGCRTTGSPWNNTSAGTKFDAATTSVTMGAQSTTEPNTLVVAVVAAGTDTTTAQASGWAGTGLTGVTERADSWTTSGDGGGFAVATGVKDTAGVVGPITATLATAARYAYIWLALGAPPAASGEGTTQTPHQFWRLRLLNTPGAGPECNEVEIVTRDGTAAGAGSTIANPAKMHPGVTHLRPMFAPNWNDGADPTGEWDIDKASLTLPAGHVPTLPGDSLRRELHTLFDEDGILKPTVRQSDGATAQPFVKGLVTGTGQHGDVISYLSLGRTFLTPPRVRFSGGITHEPRSVWGTAAEIDAGSGNTDAFDSAKAVEENCAALDADESGFILRARLRQQGTVVTARVLVFAGTTLNEVDETDTISTLTNAPAVDDVYHVHVTAQARLRSANGSTYSVSIAYVVETSFDSGSTWQIRASRVVTGETRSTTYVTQDTSPPSSYLTVAGLTADGTDRIRLRIWDIVEEGLGDYVTADTWVMGESGFGVAFNTATDSFADKTPGKATVEWEALGYF